VREYEVTIIFQPELTDDDRAQLMERIQGWMAPAEGELQADVDEWGMRQLAYPIRDFRQGYYIYMDATLEPSQIAEIERNLQYNDEILRYLFVRKSG
jgi:small subunit ribosomal protein S6